MIDRALPVPPAVRALAMGLAGAGGMAFLAGLLGGGIGPGWVAGLLALAGHRLTPWRQVLLVLPSLLVVRVYTQADPLYLAAPVMLAMVGVLVFMPSEGSASPAAERTTFAGVCLLASVVGALVVDFSVGALLGQLLCVVVVVVILAVQAVAREIRRAGGGEPGDAPRGLGVEIF